MRHKILIIKVGYSETLDPEISTVTSYGDVLRSTVLLNLYKENHVTWLVDEKAYPILKNNPHIDRVLIYNLTSILHLQAEHFDTVINLEKVPGLCALADSITAWRRYGFRFDVKQGAAEAYQGTEQALALCNNKEKKEKHNRTWQEFLFEMVGAKWTNEEYVFGYEPASQESFDVGFNYKVGEKWPEKGWPLACWKALEAKMDPDLSISWQEGLNNMEEYFDWIQRCRVLVTNDSFGLHLALAMKKSVIALFTITNPRETHLYGLGQAFISNNKMAKKINHPDLPLSIRIVPEITPDLVKDAIHQRLLIKVL
jgi:heptosyltransferase II